jgi:hypothetical protein
MRKTSEAVLGKFSLSNLAAEYLVGASRTYHERSSVSNPHVCENGRNAIHGADELRVSGFEFCK